MSGKGGYQRPGTPAPVSGPGKFSQRTDGHPGETPTQAAHYLSGEKYGQGQSFNQTVSSVPLAAAPAHADLPVPLDAPTQRPDEPVTAGVDAGPGPGSEILPPPNEYAPSQQADMVSYVIKSAYAAHPSPALRVMVQQLEAAGR